MIQLTPRRRVRAQDVRYDVRPSQHLSAVPDYVGCSCNGLQDQLNKQPMSRIMGDFALPTGDSTRLGIVQDQAGRPWYQHRVWCELADSPSGSVPANLMPPRRDATNAGGIRAEYVVYAATGRSVLAETVYWQAFTLDLFGDLGGLSDDQSLMQHKQEGPTGPQSHQFPYLVLRLKHGRLRVSIRSVDASPCIDVWVDQAAPQSGPHDYVLRFVVSPNAERGAVSVWRDGVLMANYRGPLGDADCVDQLRQVRLGWYCYGARDVAAPDRWMRTGRHVLVSDAGYEERAVRALLSAT